MIPRIELSALLAPYRARPGTATGFPAHTTGRCGDADGPASAPPSGAAATAPPAGAVHHRKYMYIHSYGLSVNVISAYV
jgi:hypothetical protein